MYDEVNPYIYIGSFRARKPKCLIELGDIVSARARLFNEHYIKLELSSG